MVRVIGEAKKHVEQVCCPNCSSELEYTKSDVKEYHGRDYSGGTDGQEWIDCPRCSHKVVLRSW